jgi:hypothetical protein
MRRHNAADESLAGAHERRKPPEPWQDVNARASSIYGVFTILEEHPESRTSGTDLWPHGHSRLFPLGRFLFSDGRYTSERIDARSEAQNHPFHPNVNVNVEVESRVMRKLLG